MAPSVFMNPPFEERTMKNFVMHGDMVTIIAAAAIASGDLIRAGSLLGVAATSAATGEEVELKTTGVFFGGLVIFIILVVGALTFLPALSLGPVADYYTAVG